MITVTKSLPARGILHGIVMLIPLGLCLVLLLGGVLALFRLLRALDVLLPPERLRPLHLLLHQPVDGALLALRQPGSLLLLLPLRLVVILLFLFLRA